jgi:2-oxoglutarate/2-oxoacid ferredoxin oxidoreductase subunit beta
MPGLEVIPEVFQYLRRGKKLSHVWCPGCGNGIVFNALLRAIHKLQIPKEEIAVISGIGCSSRLPVYTDFCSIHTAHGRALTFATGVKLAKPKMKVIVITGDGDATAIGGNHFIHTARRNIDITVILVDNYNYGMTGGQYSPTTPEGKRATTAPYGNVEKPFDICELARGAGAPFIARGTCYKVTELTNLIAKGITKEAFSLVNVMSFCHTIHGRLNKMPQATAMMHWLKDSAVSSKAAAKMDPEKLEGKLITGVLVDEDEKSYHQKYAEFWDEKIRPELDSKTSFDITWETGREFLC